MSMGTNEVKANLTDNATKILIALIGSTGDVRGPILESNTTAVVSAYKRIFSALEECANK